MSVETLDRDLRGGDIFPQVSRDALMRVPAALATRYSVLAYRSDGEELHVLVPDVRDDALLDRVRSVTGMRVVPRAASPEALKVRIATAYGGADEPQERGDAPPAIRAVDEIHESAVCARASDIHIEPSPEGGRVRLRIDGMLRETKTLSAQLLVQVVSRVKLLAAMDIADRRQPQDGGYDISIFGRSIDARVSSIPTISGEKLVVRLLDMHADVPSLERLGMPTPILDPYRALVHAPYGFIVVCGPTGSGKTTTLYASMAERNVEGQHLCSVEDPVEVRMSGVAQVQVNERAGMTFAAALRSFLRQDPNVLMVGEMRDAETAKVALSAALSGQLIMTTLHASDAPRAIERLIELGLARHALAAGLSGILAQRLVRKLCSNCRRPTRVNAREASVLGLMPGAFVYESSGCSECGGSGYRGRTGIFELLLVNDAIRSAIAHGHSSVDVAELASNTGYRSMLVDGARALIEGATSTNELARVLSIGAHR